MVGGLKPPSVQDEEEAANAKGQGVIFCLEEAQLEVAQVGKVGPTWAHGLRRFIIATGDQPSQRLIVGPSMLSAYLL